MTTYTYDLSGKLLTQSDALGNTISYFYDANSRLIQNTDPMGNNSSYTYNAVGNLISITDREDNIISYSYDALKRRLSEIDQLGNTTTFAYDNRGDLLSITDANGNVTSYSYDNVNRLIQETYADSTTRGFSYNPAGNMIARTDQNGNVTVYVYDALNRKIKDDYPDSNDSYYTYDAVGNILTANNQNATLSFSYDNVYRLAQSAQNSQTVSYSYDIPNRSKTITYPSGKVIKEVRNPRELLVRVENTLAQPLVQYTYDNADRLQTKMYLNAITASFTNNSNGWMTDLNYDIGGTRLIGLQCNLDKEGNRQSVNKLHHPSNSEKYIYDAKYRLIQFARGILDANGNVPNPVMQTAYNLDSLGNWKSKTTDGITQNRSHNEMNEIINVDGLSYVYDDNGNIVDDGTNTYEYDYENRLKKVTSKLNGAVLGEYRYDALGRRIEKQAYGVTTLYFYNGNRVVEEQISGITKATYVYGILIDEVISMERNGEYYYLTDSLGHIVALTDTGGNIVEEYIYSPYGQRSVIGSAFDNPYMFTGRRFDQESRLYYYRSRYYSPEAGRFFQRDAFGYISGMNLYEYVKSSPINYTDPFGLVWWNPWDWMVGAERWIWQQVANYYMRPKNLYISAEFLEHSLQDNPVDLIPYNGATGKIRNASEYSSFVRNIPDGNFISWTGPSTIEFRSDRDLFTAFQHVKVYYKGCKKGATYYLEIRITDTYTFHWQNLETSSFFNFLATLGANVAYIDQLLGIINPYDIQIEFKDP